MLVGYARVSTLEQDTALQLDALKAARVRRVFQDHGSGVGPRPELQRLLASLRAGDVLVVWKLDRIARSLFDLLGVMRRLAAIGASIRSLTEPIDTSTPIGEFVVQVLGAVAQLERSMIRERVMAGQAAAMARGKRWGPRRVMIPDAEARLVALYLAGGYTYVSVAREFGVTPSVARCAVMRVVDPLAYYTPRK